MSYTVKTNNNDYNKNKVCILEYRSGDLLEQRWEQWGIGYVVVLISEILGLT